MIDNKEEKITYHLSCGNKFDGKSVCLWRGTKNCFTKIARFQNDESAAIFAKEFNFPLGDALKERLSKLKI